ncbi:MAG: winged helix DNA-binding domain-containing protein [Opitutus sp.]|nr:winged helix DNA-binding domain-containing protein [Opitutus sp.]
MVNALAQNTENHLREKTAGTPARLTLRELNRATLARQLLLSRENLGVPAALERVAGLQAQLPGPPNIGLWSRLENFSRPHVIDLLESRAIVRAPLLRGTLHLVSAADYAQFRAVVAPMLHRSLAGMDAGRLRGIDPVALSDEARPFLRECPRTQDEVREFLGARHPKLDVRMVGHAVRMHLPLVQVPERGAGAWDFPAMPRFALAEAWIGRPLATSADPRELIRRYLAAFGPASARDFQTWSALTGAREEFARLRSELRVFNDENGRELFDLPDAPLPGGDAPAPVRFLPEYDNVLLAHHDRNRVIAEEHRPRVFLPGLRVAATLLVEGMVRGTWKIERAKKNTTLVVTPFAALAKKDREAVEREAGQLARFVEPTANEWSVSFGK